MTEWKNVDPGRRFHAREGLQTSQHPRKERVDPRAERHAKRQEPLRVEAQINGCEMAHGGDHQAGAGQQDQRQGDLGDDERASEAQPPVPRLWRRAPRPSTT